MNRYYSNEAVQARILEFLGGDSVEKAACEYLTGGNSEHSRHREPRPVGDLPALWEAEMDISRSLWDREWLLLHLDIEYVNFDHPFEPYAEPERIFALQRPVEWAAATILSDYGIVPLHLLSGRGHHFIWKIRQGSPAFRQLTALGRVPPSLTELHARPHRPHGRTVSPQLGAAFAGAGVVMEHLAHRIKQVSAPFCDIPVELTAVEVGPRELGREMISIDISEYADPLSTRVIRVPFSRYLKPQQQRGTLGEENVKRLAPVFLIPWPDRDLRSGLAVMHDPNRAGELARRSSARIPDHTGATDRLIAAYRKSALKKFHDWFYRQEHEPPERWPETYDRTPVELLPQCAAHILNHPNDLLLKPAGVSRIVRVLLALGWHPRQVAGLIRSKFEREHGWGEQWKGYDPSARADFYTRVFAGLFVAGVDDLVDFNCQSAQEEKLCFIEHCPDNLERFRASLLNRRKYERLASRPFHGLFLPEEHP